LTQEELWGILICPFWNPEESEKRVFRVQNSTDFSKEQQTFIAIEFDLVEGNRSFDSAVRHFRWDLLKLEENEVEHGYQLVFARDWVNKGDFLSQFKKEAEKALNVSVLFIEASRIGTAIQAVTHKAFLKFGKLLQFSPEER
jgi:hypothetical protein